MRTIIITLTAVTLLTAVAAAQNELELVWTGAGETNYNYFGAGMTGVDFDHDSYSDVLIGAKGWNDGQGKVYLFLGSPDFFEEATFELVGDTVEDYFDRDISNLQDIDLDGFYDFIVPGRERVELYFGGVDFDTVPDWQVQKHGSEPSSPEYFGASTDSVGDVNGDGWSDFVISGGDYELHLTYFEIYFSSLELDTIPDWHYYTEAYYNYAFIVEGLGDINGDGFDDVLAYKPVSSSVTTYPAQVFYGGSPMDTIPDLEFIPYAICAGGIGDVNDDGYNDLAMYKRFNSDPLESHTVVYFGGAGVDTLPDVILEGAYTPDTRCNSMFSHADVNGDGIEDIVCEGGWDFNYLYVYLGSPWFNGTPDWWYSEYHMIDGITLSGVGDVNGDGCDEIVLGMPEYNFQQGKVYLYAGNPDLIDLGAPVEPGDLPRTPGWYKLDQNYPNPFNASTTIHFELGKLSTVSMTVFDLRGNKIRSLIRNKEMRPGGYNISWSGKNEFSQPVSSGIYLLELRVDQFRQIQKMVLLR